MIPRDRVLIFNGSLKNSRISISENVLNQVEVERGGRGQPEEKDQRCLPFPTLGSKQFRSALGKKKNPGLKIFSNKLFSDRCQTHSIQTCTCPVLPSTLVIQITLFNFYDIFKNVIWANNIHQRGGRHESMYQYNPDFLRLSGLCDFRLTLLLPKRFSSRCFQTLIFGAL